MERINWKKIDVITYSYDGMSDEAVAEVLKAFDRQCYYESIGETKKAAYIRKRLDAKKNYVWNQ